MPVQTSDLKVQSAILAEKLLIFKLNTPALCAPEATCWLAGIVYGSVQASMLVSHLQSQDEYQTFF